LARRIGVVVAVGLWSLSFACLADTAGRPESPQVRVVALPEDVRPFFPILAGPPDTVSMESGLVTVEPGRSVGLHSTGRYEELLVPLEGEGEVRMPGMHAVPIKRGWIVYSPPGTEHDVVNTGRTPLRYVFIVARVP